MTDERPSIAELQRIQVRVLAGDRPPHIHNPMVAVLAHWQPVLLEIAAAALALRDAHGELDAIELDMPYVGVVSFDQLVGGRSTHDAKVKVNECGATLLAALAKVRP